MLKRAIQSAVDQNVEGLEVCVFDNDSGDETSQIVGSFLENGSPVHYHKHDCNIGAADNFEFGLRSVNTPFFSILSDDDYLLPGFYQSALDELAENPQAMFWAGVTINVDENNTIWDARVDRWEREGIFDPPDGLMNIMNGMSPTWTGILFRREVLKNIGFPDKETLGPSDLDFVLKIAAEHQYIVRKLPAAVFTLNASSFSNTQPLSSFWPGWKKMFLNLDMAVQNYDEINKQEALNTLHKDAQRMLYRRGANAIAQGRLDFARDAANELKREYNQSAKTGFLRIIAWLCESIPYVQKLYSSLYKQAEKRILAKRRGLQEKYQHLIRPL
jgi:glycosyltransferase involved in cell wall biosynthesis